MEWRDSLPEGLKSRRRLGIGGESKCLSSPGEGLNAKALRDEAVAPCYPNSFPFIAPRSASVSIREKK